MTASDQDWRALLVRYIRHVGQVEGADFLGDFYTQDMYKGDGDKSPFTDQELDLLRKLAKEADSGSDYD